MGESYSKATAILKKYEQEHLLSFYDELSKEQKKAFLRQILSTNFEEITTLYELSLETEIEDFDLITPQPYVVKAKLSKQELSYYIGIGMQALYNKEYAVCTMAGGQRHKARIQRAKRCL